MTDSASSTSSSSFMLPETFQYISSASKRLILCAGIASTQLLFASSYAMYGVANRLRPRALPVEKASISPMTSFDDLAHFCIRLFSLWVVLISNESSQKNLSRSFIWFRIRSVAPLLLAAMACPICCTSIYVLPTFSSAQIESINALIVSLSSLSRSRSRSIR